jgi:hypothetical protein
MVSKNAVSTKGSVIADTRSHSQALGLITDLLQISVLTLPKIKSEEVRKKLMVYIKEYFVGGMTQAVVLLPPKIKALSSNSRTTKRTVGELRDFKPKVVSSWAHKSSTTVRKYIDLYVIGYYKLTFLLRQVELCKFLYLQLIDSILL